MAATNNHSRRYVFAVTACLTLAASAYGLARFFPALGPIAGTIAPQMYVDSLPTAQIPTQGRYVLVDAASARLYMVPCTEDSWKSILARVEETECDGVELNFGCPHGVPSAGSAQGHSG